MLTIENAYYSKTTDQIHVIMYNDSPGIDPWIEAITGVVLKKIIDDKEYVFDCEGHYYTQEFDSNMQIHIYIPINEVPISSGEEFSISGVTTVEVSTIYGPIERTIWDSTEFYKYKTSIIESEEGRGGTVRAAKKIARFSFYEQMLLNAAYQGFSTDAAIYYNEMVRMASYGIPNVKQEQCYL